MRRWILFVFSMALLYYVALIYHSLSMLFCVCALLLLEAGVLFHALLVFRRLHIHIRTPLLIAEAGSAIPVELTFVNDSCLPAGQVRVRIGITYLMRGKRQYIRMRTVVPGRKRGQRSSSIRLKFDVIAEHPGRVQISVKQARVFDLLGILSLPLRKKYIGGQSMVCVLPERQEIPLEIDGMVRQFAMDRETEIRIPGEKNPPEIAQIREYQPGDALRNIHWKLTAKQDKLMVCEHISEQSCPILFFVDLRQVSDRFLQVFYSFGMELLRQKCSFYLVYYAKETGDLIRTAIMGEEDFYEYFLQTDLMDQTPIRWNKRRKHTRRGKKQAKTMRHTLDWETEYREKYRQITYAAKLVLWQDLICTYNDEIIWEEGKVAS
ncbi:MAG: DUF58 domain-containing protein [Eubacteriales bacterium]|nr:DUF58 domain-containing protein [Eubacteriales bacterium]